MYYQYILLTQCTKKKGKFCKRQKGEKLIVSTIVVKIIMIGALICTL